MEKRGQIFSLDFIIGFSLMILTIGLTINFFEVSATHARETVNRTELWNMAVLGSDGIVKNPSTICELVTDTGAHIDFLPNCVPQAITIVQSNLELPKDFECELSSPNGATISFTFDPSSEDSGFLDPTVAVNPFVKPLCSLANPGVFTSGDGSEATCDNDSGIYANTFNFSIPASANINGIEVRFEKKVSGEPYKIKAQLYDAGSNLVGIQKETAFFSNTDYDTVVLGGPADLWGSPPGAWLPSSINLAPFGVRILFESQSGASTDDVLLENVDIRVTYTGTSCGETLPPDEANYVSIDRRVVVLNKGAVRQITKAELLNCQKRAYNDPNPACAVLERAVLRLKVWKK